MNDKFFYNSELFKTTNPRSIKRQKTDSDSETYLWHLRLGHIGLDRINRLVKDGPLRELSIGSLPVCESCLEGKMTKRPFSAKGSRATEPLQLVHTDVAVYLMYKQEEVMNISSLSLTIIQDMVTYT